MTILIIDNYDSFTFNLYQLAAEVSGNRVDVIKNDDRASWEALKTEPVEAIILSPGPGRPDVESDFGISRLALQTDLPLLGVCLGHQGLCHFEGGTVGRGAEPMHGRVSTVSHDGSGIFTGIPSPFEAVRYHSLVVHDVPDCLRITGRSADRAGTPVVMAVAHRTRPQWGVQFHPESISTEHGRLLIENFLGLARRTPRRFDARGTSRPAASRPAQGIPARPAGRTERPVKRRHRLLSHQLEHHPAAEAVYTALFAAGDCAFWLDSSAVVAGLSRHSILGGRGPLGEWVTAIANRGVRVQTATGAEAHLEESIFDYLARETAARAVEGPPSGCGFALGYVGYLGYELKAECGGDLVHASDLPDAAFLYCDRAVIIDHLLGRTWLLTLVDEDTELAGRSWLAEAACAVLAAPVAGAAGVAAPTPEVPVPFTARDSPEEYRELIGHCLAEIREGETYEVCLTTTMTARARIDPVTTYRELRRRSPVPYGALLHLPGVDVLSASPERFLTISADREVEAKPIKGTRRRGRTPVEDARLAAELGTAEKDRSENLMIVDLLRNDLGKVAAIGSVHVPTAFAVETYATVHQLVSTVRARLREDVSPVDCVRAAFPGGSMTGAPKIRTMQIIDRLERGGRGVYSGALGYFSLTGSVDLSIVIRTLVVRGEDVSVGAGGAVVALSDAGEEVAEMQLKAEVPMAAVRVTAQPPGPDQGLCTPPVAHPPGKHEIAV
ncbi:aminodeoxychorismate synthase component I [Pseudonocardia broussonetiae]|uniref:aminodeoxychorismate synthase n=1 Tax=Pseudonocardia broussonetiae TaxID=2736640 RepID=A0A6M6JCQ1_9PSEU|nr:aminodeoxychorismate synthase component I [Pseudonocardia broussonetiae]QJY45724.1 aminodeoxychorismate synthase component I [Pseudonocardia broussonetiae]